MKRALAIQLIPIILLVLAVCTPIIYTAVSSISTWAIALTLAWILLLVVYVGLAVIKWK
ncbi:MAG: hypothetical protein LZ166_01335 [Thaumarchaeota archaeon]|jgi:hypothetical protein|nr:hypothetical protein [Candidatus Wolframiiraptor allenii]